MKINLSLLYGVLFTAVTHQSHAMDRHMALTGSDTGNDCTSEAEPCASLQYAMSQMSGGDTLFIDDGEYSTANNTIDQFNVPPSGISGNFTVIRAKNIPCQDGVPCDEALRVKFSGDATFSCTNNNNVATYVKFWGIRWNGIGTYTGWDNIYFKQVASHGVQSGNSTAIAINGKNNLLEDVVAFGKGRYKFLFYDTTRTGQVGNNLCRRCVARHDWAMRDDVAPQPIAGFSSYYNRGTACINCLVIDSDMPTEWQNEPTEISGAYYQPVDGGPHALTLSGSMAINVAMPFLATRSGSTGHILKDVVAVKVAGGILARGALDIDNLTMVDVGMNNFVFRSSTQAGRVMAPDDGILLFGGDGPVTLDNSIMSDIADSVVQGADVTSNYVNTYQIGGTKYVGSSAASNEVTTDPQTNGLLYPVRVEPASTLVTQGSSSGRIGANVTQKLGTDGSFKGDIDWDTEQGALWPWPLEEWMKAEIRTSEYGASPMRGFAADNESLTNYIWGFLGNTVPPFNVKHIREIGNSQAVISWDRPAESTLASITNFKVYSVVQGGGTAELKATVNKLDNSVVVTGLSPSEQYDFWVTAVSGAGESGYSYLANKDLSGIAPPNPPVLHDPE